MTKEVRPKTYHSITDAAISVGMPLRPTAKERRANEDSMTRTLNRAGHMPTHEEALAFKINSMAMKRESAASKKGFFRKAVLVGATVATALLAKEALSSTPKYVPAKTHTEIDAANVRYGAYTKLSEDPNANSVKYIVHNGDPSNPAADPDTATGIAGYFDSAHSHPELIDDINAALKAHPGLDDVGVEVVIPRADITNPNAPGYQGPSQPSNN